MSTFLSFLSAQKTGIAVLFAAAVALMAILSWACWLLGLGRFRGAGGSKDSKLRFVLANFFVEIVNDFKHLLALVIAVLFALTLFAAMLPGMMKGDVNSIKDGLQAAAAALSGLMGSIIGYYFGESAAARKQPPATKPAAPEAVQNAEIKPAKEPPVESQ